MSTRAPKVGAGSQPSVTHLIENALVPTTFPDIRHGDHTVPAPRDAPRRVAHQRQRLRDGKPSCALGLAAMLKKALRANQAVLGMAAA